MFGALLVASMLAQPVPPHGGGGGNCAPGKDCVAATFRATNGSTLIQRNGAVSPKMCLNSSTGADNTVYTWYNLKDNGSLYLAYTLAPAANSCPEGSTILSFDWTTNVFNNNWYLRHADRELYQGSNISGMGTCANFSNPATNTENDARTHAYCNLKQWSNFATVGSIYTAGTVATQHPNLPTGVDLQATYAGPRRIEQCYVDPEGTADPTCTGFITAPAKGGVNCAANATDTTTNWLSLVKFPTAGASGDYCSYEKNAGYVRTPMFPRITWTWRPQSATTTNLRYWVGWRGTATLFTTDTPAGAWCAFRYSTAVPDATWQACSSDGTTQSCDDTGVSFSASNVYTMSIEATIDSCVFTMYDRTFTLVSTNAKNTNVPLTTSSLFPIIGVEALTNASRTISISKLVQEHQ